MEAYKVSVIVPVYNAEKYIEMSIRSAVCQKYKAVQLVIVDDGSGEEYQRFFQAQQLDQFLIPHGLVQVLLCCRRNTVNLL